MLDVGVGNAAGGIADPDPAMVVPVDEETSVFALLESGREPAATVIVVVGSAWILLEEQLFDFSPHAAGPTRALRIKTKYGDDRLSDMNASIMGTL